MSLIELCYFFRFSLMKTENKGNFLSVLIIAIHRRDLIISFKSIWYSQAAIDATLFYSTVYFLRNANKFLILNCCIHPRWAINDKHAYSITLYSITDDGVIPLAQSIYSTSNRLLSTLLSIKLVSSGNNSQIF